MGHVSSAENPAVCSSLARSTLPKLVTCQRESASGRSLDPVSKFAICGPAKSGTLHGTDPSISGAAPAHRRTHRMAMLGNVIELTVVVRDLEAAIER